MGAVLDGQVTRGSCRENIVRSDIRRSCHHGEVVVIAAVVVRGFRWQQAVCRRVADRRGLACHHVSECAGGVAVLHSAVVFDCFVRNAHRHGSRGDGQFAGHRCDVVVRRHVFIPVHHLVSCCNGVVVRRNIGHVGHAARGMCHQLVACQQVAARHRDGGVGQRSAVVDHAVACRRDGDEHFSFRHRQLAVRLCDAVVAGRSCRERVASHRIRHRALAREGDATGHCRGDGVSADQTVHVIAVVAVRRAVVGECFAMGGHGDRFRLDGQLAGLG